MPPPWPTWIFWQYTNTGRIPGHKGPIDLNCFNGTPEDLNDLHANCRGAVSAPTQETRTHALCAPDTLHPNRRGAVSAPSQDLVLSAAKLALKDEGDLP